tara:strand:- start:9389 stop:9730 length:342 start_codon:yes stop_codon:yes gene_type:complete
MHELSLAEAMLDIIKDQAKQDDFTRVTKVVLEVGTLSHVEADAMSFCFDAVVAGTLVEGSSLQIVHISATGKCPQCHKISDIQNLYDPCTHCGKFGLELTDGDQLRIRHLEVE